MNKHVKKYAGNKAVGLFEQDETIQKLQTMGNPLEALSQVVDFEVYRDILEKALLTPEEEKKSNEGSCGKKYRFGSCKGEYCVDMLGVQYMSLHTNKEKQSRMDQGLNKESSYNILNINEFKKIEKKEV